jgi:hypothetical protein
MRTPWPVWGCWVKLKKTQNFGLGVSKETVECAKNEIELEVVAAYFRQLLRGSRLYLPRK